MLNKSLSISNFTKLAYILVLFLLSLYYFVDGYGNYIKFSKKNDQIIEKNEIYDFSKEIDNNYTDNSSYSITRFKSELKKFSWTNKKEKQLAFEKTEVASVMNKMIENNYDIDNISFKKEIPGFFIDELPEDIQVIKDIETRKKIFISIVLPLIVETNRNIILKRDRLEKIYNKLINSKTLSLSEHNWLVNLAAKYSIETKQVHKITVAKNLLKHIDVIPNSIAIAQAAKESGWGTSRFAKEGNALFGQWTYDNANGLLPEQRSQGDGHLVRSFDNLRESVISYMNNINTHRAYDSFRNLRFQLRENNETLNSLILVHELSAYAELPNYTQILQIIIEKNKLYIFDDLKLVDKNKLV